jgi:hypothetical protein
MLLALLSTSRSVSQMTEDTPQSVLAVQQYFHCDYVYMLHDDNDGKCNSFISGMQILTTLVSLKICIKSGFYLCKNRYE